MSVLRLPLHLLLMHPDSTLNLRHLADLLDGTRVDTRPVEVTPGGCGHYAIRGGGAARYAYALITGQNELVCQMTEGRG